MIKAYFGMLLAELAEHPVVRGIPGVELTEQQIKQRKNRESALRETLGKMKQFASWFTHGIPGGATLRKQIFESKDGNAVLGAVERFFESRHGIAEPELELVASSYPFRG